MLSSTAATKPINDKIPVRRLSKPPERTTALLVASPPARNDSTRAEHLHAKRWVSDFSSPKQKLHRSSIKQIVTQQTIVQDLEIRLQQAKEKLERLVQQA